MTEHVHSMMPMLPGWIRLLWMLALAVVAAVHIWHGVTMTGQARWWHGAHTVMAVGMLAMYAADPMRQAGLDRALVVVFAVVTVAIAATAAALSRREGRANPLWAATGSDTAAMVYMAVIMAPVLTVSTTVSWVIVAYLGVQTLAWLFGVWERTLSPRRSSPGLSGPFGYDVRLSLAVMTASMGYMLAAMAS
ncbi:DUF5134 domain-containing protein [Mycolicibacterium elephantis]|uniref:DUF5134 domain-containing protein n=1 Tax=Mycolicibacterium elephantis DSM 44368 TaxID=1335622 RepID=A0A439DUE8_9MYCO|nr:DUF5134 domain-containing protein [Mycolicibacterium elephantis]MCV7220991.1 DUF5134 domain-containing protein [Mycolicibacterium elephantis]RWA20224.1 hypothetical protein MELE44368_18680 [Mycolicibacterium elephantis DSM 44368]